MAFSALELSNIANAALDYHERSDARAQSIQNKPLMKALTAKQKYFPSGKGNITVPVKGDFTTAIQGFSGNDTVSYANPANIKRAVYPWKEIHAGIAVTLTELKMDGISVVDSMNSKSTTEHSDRELTAITDLLQDKLQDMEEGRMRTFNTMLWQDGTQDAKQVPGILSLITDAAVTGVTGGIDRSTATWWQNRALVGASKITSSASNQTLSVTLRSELRQLKRFSSNPKFQIFAGSGFLTALETEVQAKGNYTLTGFNKDGATDIGMQVLSLNGVGEFTYDPTLDQLGLPKRCYIIDMGAIQLMPMQDEDWKMHSPARPYNVYALYRASTWTGGLVARQLNSCGVYEVA